MTRKTDSIQLTKPQGGLYAASSHTAPGASSAGKNTGLQKGQALQEENEGATVAISAEGLGLSKKNQDEDALAKEAIERKMYQEMLENANEAAEAQGEGFGDLAKALEIARRILDGDIVPPQDEKFLMEFNSEIYMRVKSMAKQKEDPEEYESLMEEEEDNKSSEKTGGGENLNAGENADIVESAETSSEGAQP